MSELAVCVLARMDAAWVQQCCVSWGNACKPCSHLWPKRYTRVAGAGTVSKQDKCSLSSNQQDLRGVQHTKFCRTKQVCNCHFIRLCEFLCQMAWESWQRAMHAQCLNFESICRPVIRITFHNIFSSFFEADNAFASFKGDCFSTLSSYSVPSFILLRTLSLTFWISSELLKNLKSHGASYFTVVFGKWGKGKVQSKTVAHAKYMMPGPTLVPGWVCSLCWTPRWHATLLAQRSVRTLQHHPEWLQGGHRQYVTLNTFSYPYGRTSLSQQDVDPFNQKMIFLTTYFKVVHKYISSI